MEDVLLSFKIFEGFFSVSCAIIHIHGFIDLHEPFPHEMIFCGTFFGFFLVSIFGCIAFFENIKTSLLLEALISGTAFFFFILSSIYSMYHAENDMHLMYLSDAEEWNHPFFYMNKAQSIFSLVGGLLYLLHMIFSIDALVIKKQASAETISESSDDTDYHLNNKAQEPIKLYLFCRPLFKIIVTTCIRQKRTEVRDDTNIPRPEQITNYTNAHTPDEIREEQV